MVADVFISAKRESQCGQDWGIDGGLVGENGKSPTNGPFFPLHSACLNLLQHYTQYQSSAGSLQPPTTFRNLVDAYAARLEYTSKLHSAACESGQQGKFPPGYTWYGTVEWSHLYFGARRFWADPWDCEPGMEFLCADPIREPRTEHFISTCLAHPQSNRQNQSSPSSQRQLSETPRNASLLIQCPREILTLISSYLPLRSALNLHSTSRGLTSRLPSTDMLFWRSRALQLHGPWFWELHNPRISSANANWRALLQILTTTRGDILAGSKPYWHDKLAIEDSVRRKRGDENANITFKTLTPLPSLPLGLKNRQRIWMCLECVSMKGPQRRMQGLADEETIEQIRNSSSSDHGW